jgi:predicted acyl esterase/plastocyanin
MSSLLGDILSTDPDRKGAVQSLLRQAILSGSKVVSLIPWVLVKAASRVMFSRFPSDKQGPLGPPGPDDGRYDYGLSQPTYGVIFESKITIPMRDGTKLEGDVFRPDVPGRFPVIMAEAPYPRYMKAMPGVDDTAGVGIKYLQFEQANPEYWVPRGYVYVTFNTRGYGGSEGQTSALDYQEYEDFYDAIEWAAEQPWSNGNVGLYGISYYAFSQYFVCYLQPPHLKAIVPWEGLADPYRDIGYRGGIPCFFSINFAAGSQIIANNLWTATDYLRMFFELPLMSEFWEYGARASSRPPGSTPTILEAISGIDVPMLSVGNLNDPDLHLRGNVYAFRAAKSRQKKLLLYSGTHWGSAYQPWANRTVLRFFDHYLKGTDTGIEKEPAVDVQLRTGSDTFTHLYGDTWPLEGTEWTKYYLDARDKTLSTKDAEVDSSSEAQWAREELGSSHQLTFLTEPLERDVQIAGPVNAHLWVSTEGKDVDLTVELRDFDENGRETCFSYVFAGMRDETVTRGWLRASLRALDPERSQPHQPFYLFNRNEWLTPGVPVALDIEIWPTAMLFKAGHRIGLTVHCGPYKRKGEVMAMLKLPFRKIKVRVPMYRTFSPRCGATRIHTGGGHSSWLELPVIPADPAPTHGISIADGGFAPKTASGGMGDRFEWTNRGDDYHSVTESSGLGLWDSQIVRGTRSHNPETWWTKVPWAGTFAYRDMVSGFEGTIEIPDRVSSSASKGSKLDVEIAVEPPPQGIGFDVQLKAEKGDWETIHEGIRDTRITIAKLPPGNYAVRSRLRRTDAAGPPAESGWSPPADFTIK